MTASPLQDMKDNNGSTPLAWAVAHGNAEATQALLDLGVFAHERGMFRTQFF